MVRAVGLHRSRRLRVRLVQGLFPPNRLLACGTGSVEGPSAVWMPLCRVHIQD